MKAVFLDRDGTVVVEKGYLTVPEAVELYPGVPEAVAALREAGWKIVVVSNQGAVAKGLITEEELAGINERMLMMLGAEGAQVDGVYCCPHHPEGEVAAYAVECDCRKPKPGLLEQAARDHGLDLSQCVIVGDTPRDLQAGRAVGTRTVLVLTGHGAETSLVPHGADHVAADLLSAARWILGGMIQA
jgi:D-glycero-D-manno-heptose 1,7-bisphosphate phosphatase